MSETVVAVVPARWGSSRFPGKALADLCGKPLVQHVYEATRRSDAFERVVVATDDARILDAVRAFSGEAMMTSDAHRSGTDRLVEVAEGLEAAVYVNVQGDEPLIRPNDLSRLAAAMLADPSVDVGTLCHPIDAQEARNPNRVKVVRRADGNALYFSRSPIPYGRDPESASYLQHVGVYAYRRDALLGFSALDVPMEEHAEQLEQLRLLHAGFAIRVLHAERGAPGVDTPADLERVAAILRGHDTSTDARPRIELLLCDVDGVLTDGGLFYGPEGELIKRFDVKDGLGLKRLMRAGVQVAIVSGRRCSALEVRLSELGIEEMHLGVGDKSSVARDIKKRLGVRTERTAAAGDDLPDLALFEEAAVRFAPSDARHEVRQAATRVLESPGGHGAVRELAEHILGPAGSR